MMIRGMFVEFMRKEEEILLTCIEYDSAAKGIYARLYRDIHSDDPTESIRYEELEE